MKKKLLISLLAVGALFGLASCAEEHTHEFAQDWLSDSTGHWHDSTCDHKVISDFAAHTEGVDGKCIVCGYVVTPPTNVATLTSIDVNADAAKVYYHLGDTLSTAGVKVYETYENTLTDDTLSLVSDLSGYTVKVFDTSGVEVTGAFSAFGSYSVVVSKGELSDNYEVKVGTVVYANASDALEVGVSNGSKISNGVAVINQFGEETVFTYAFGENYTTYNNGESDYHLTQLEDETVFGVYEHDGEVYAIYGPTLDDMNGVDFSAYISYYDYVYGTEQLLNAIYTLGNEETSWNYVEGVADLCTVCGVQHSYTLSFEALIEDFYYVFFDVEFALDPVAGSISSANISMEVYYSYNLTLDEEAGTYSINEDITEPDYTRDITISQETGDRVAENNNGPEVYQFTSYDLTFDGDVVGTDSIVTSPGNSVVLAASNAVPSSATFAIDEPIVEYTCDTDASAYGYYESNVGGIQFTPYGQGTFTVTVTTVNITKTFTVVSEYAEVTEISGAIYSEVEWDYVAVTEYSCEVGSEVEISAIVNENANPEFTASLPEGTENATVESLYGSTYFSATAEGTYVVTVTSVANPSVSATITITVNPKAASTDYVGTREVDHPYFGPTVANYRITLKSDGTGSYIFDIEGEGMFDYVMNGSNIVFSNYLCTFGTELSFTAMMFGDVIYLTAYEVIDGVKSEDYLFTIELGLPPTEVELGDNTVVGSYMGAEYSFTSYLYAETTYVITVTGGGVLVDYELLTSYEVTLGFFEAYVFTVCADEEGADVVINIAESTGTGSDEEDDINSGSVLVLGENTIACDFMGADFTFTALEAGTYTFQASRVDAYFMVENSPNGSITVTLEAEEVYTVTVCDNDNDGSALVLVSLATE